MIKRHKANVLHKQDFSEKTLLFGNFNVPPYEENQPCIQRLLYKN